MHFGNIDRYVKYCWHLYSLAVLAVMHEYICVGDQRLYNLTCLQGQCAQATQLINHLVLTFSFSSHILCSEIDVVILGRGEFCQIQSAGDTTSRSSLLDGSATFGESKRYKYNSSSSARMVTNPTSHSIDYKNKSSSNFSSGWKVATESLS